MVFSYLLTLHTFVSIKLLKQRSYGAYKIRQKEKKRTHFRSKSPSQFFKNKNAIGFHAMLLIYQFSVTIKFNIK